MNQIITEPNMKMQIEKAVFVNELTKVLASELFSSMTLFFMFSMLKDWDIKESDDFIHNFMDSWEYRCNNVYKEQFKNDLEKIMLLNQTIALIKTNIFKFWEKFKLDMSLENLFSILFRTKQESNKPST